MTKLRQRMIQDMQLRGMSERTQQSYVFAVRKLAEHFFKSPDKITEEELREYFPAIGGSPTLSEECKKILQNCK